MTAPRHCCGECSHFLPNTPAGSEGECRRYPPAVQIVMMPSAVATGRGPSLTPQPLSTFPAVTDDLLCGEFNPRPGGSSPLALI